jgi:hypothetical protein
VRGLQQPTDGRFCRRSSQPVTELPLLTDPQYRRKAQKIQAELARHDGPVEAAGLLEQPARTGRPVLKTEIR